MASQTDPGSDKGKPKHIGEKLGESILNTGKQISSWISSHKRRKERRRQARLAREKAERIRRGRAILEAQETFNYEEGEGAFGLYGVSREDLVKEYGSSFGTLFWDDDLSIDEIEQLGSGQLGDPAARSQALQARREAAEQLSQINRRHERERTDLAAAGVQTGRGGTIDELLQQNVLDGIADAEETFRLGSEAAKHTQRLVDAEDANRQRSQQASTWGLVGGVAGGVIGGYLGGPSGAAAGSQIGSGLGQYAGAKE